MQARKLITRALRLINEPGRGARLSAEDETAAFETLQEILDSEAVSKQFVPGINRHFFALEDGKAIYSYGPGMEFDTTPFGDPAPIRIEDAYIRAGARIIDNERIPNGSFEGTDGWMLGEGWSVFNNKATLSAGNSDEALAQNVPVVPGVRYVVCFNADRFAGDLRFALTSGGETESLLITQDGSYSFEHEFAADTVLFQLVAVSDESAYEISEVSILPVGQPRLELPDGQGSDYTVTLIDQQRYNRRFSKGTGGRPYEILYSRGFESSEIRFDNSGITGDILVMDVLVNKVSVTSISDTLRLQGEALKWLRYKLADEMAGEYGKQLRPDQVRILQEAWNRLSAGNSRINNLRVDRALRNRNIFDVNRGDP